MKVFEHLQRGRWIYGIRITFIYSCLVGPMVSLWSQVEWCLEDLVMVREALAKGWELRCITSPLSSLSSLSHHHILHFHQYLPYPHYHHLHHHLLHISITTIISIITIISFTIVIIIIAFSISIIVTTNICCTSIVLQ